MLHLNSKQIYQTINQFRGVSKNWEGWGGHFFVMRWQKVFGELGKPKNVRGDLPKLKLNKGYTLWWKGGTTVGWQTFFEGGVAK